MMIRPRCVAAGAPPSRVKKSRRLMGRTPTQGLLVKYSRSGPCIAAKAGRSSPVRVIFVRSTRSRRSRHVRFAPIATKFGPCGETSLSANSDLTHCSKKDCYSITLSARSTRAGGNFMAHRFCGLQIDDQLELSLLFDRKIGRLCAAQPKPDACAGRCGDTHLV